MGDSEEDPETKMLATKEMNTELEKIKKNTEKLTKQLVELDNANALKVKINN